MDNILKRRKDGSIIWSKDQINYIIAQYNQNHSTGELSKFFNTSTDAIRRCLKKNGIKVLSLYEIQTLKNHRNSNYFSKIDTKEKAYWLGFLYADGCVSKKTNTISISLSSQDEYMLSNFAKELESDNAIAHSIKKMNGKSFNISHFAIRDKQMKQDLIKWGCVPNKSYKEIELPKINNKLIWHFIRGFMDGDGSLNHSNKSLRLSFTNNSERFLNQLKKELGKDNLSLDKHKTPMLVIVGSKQLKPILDNIYKDSNDLIRLDRKYKIYLNHYGLCA